MSISRNDFETYLFDREAHPYGFWHEHVQQAINWQKILPKRILMLRYEDLKADPVHEVSRIASFLNVKVSAERISKVVEMCNLAKVKEHATKDHDNVFKNHTLGDGKLMKWKEVFTKDQLTRFDAVSHYQLRYFGYPLSKE